MAFTYPPDCRVAQNIPKETETICLYIHTFFYRDILKVSDCIDLPSHYDLLNHIIPKCSISHHVGRAFNIDFIKLYLFFLYCIISRVPNCSGTVLTNQ